MEISLSLSEFMSITAESTIESHPLSSQQQTVFATCKVKNCRPHFVPNRRSFPAAFTQAIAATPDLTAGASSMPGGDS